ncbi:MAG: hypothetical protein K2O44_01765 [Clostridia bacterium]|nr:hypothetical protein [Clostridia bacterium]
MAKSKGKIAFKIVLIVIAVVALVAVALAVTFIARYTENFKSKFSTFYVVHADTTITTDKGGYGLELNKEYRFEVGNAFGFLGKNAAGYDVKILPNATTEASFTFEGAEKAYNFSDVPDLTKQFVIDREDDHFTVRPTKLLNEMLESTYGESLTGIPTSNFKHDYLKIVVTSENETNVINLTFNVVVYPTGVNMGNGNIVGSTEYE